MCDTCNRQLSHDDALPVMLEHQPREQGEMRSC